MITIVFFLFDHSYVLLSASLQNFSFIVFKYVSNTILRYGDFYPKSTFGRLLATVWILMGIVIISLFTATVTTILLAACLANDVSLNGAKV